MNTIKIKKDVTGITFYSYPDFKLLFKIDNCTGKEVQRFKNKIIEILDEACSDLTPSDFDDLKDMVKEILEDYE